MDIREYGSGNIGATNVARLLGKRWGIVTFFLDSLKGFLPVGLFFKLFSNQPGVNFLGILVILSTVSGHNWPIFLRFKGGKGVATSVGGILALSLKISYLREPLLGGVVIWVIVFLFSRIVGLASLVSSGSFFLFCLFLERVEFEFKILSGLLFGFILIRHHSNIRALFRKKR